MPSKREVKATSQELLYRGKCFHDIRVVKNRQIACTSCGNELNIQSNRIFSHPFLGILQCEVCWNRINKAEVELNNDNNYCYVCGDNKKLYVCGNKNCSAAFCKKCIKRNASLSLLNAEDENWKCFMCDPKPFWELRAVCAAVMDSLSKKNNRRSSKKTDRRMSRIPSEKERLKKQEILPKTWQNLCDDSDSDLPKQHIVKSTQRMKSEVYLTDSSSESSFTTQANRFTSRKQRQSRADQKAKVSGGKSSRSSSKQKVSRSSMKETDKLNEDEKSDDSDDSIYTLNKPTIKTNKKLRSKKNSFNHIDSSEDESEDAEYKNRTEKLSKKVMSCSSSEENKRKQKSTSYTRNRRNSVIQEENSDFSSGEEFQKKKLQKVNSRKFLARQLDLEKDYTHTPKKLENRQNKESELNLDNVKKMLKECKEICSNFKMHIEFLEQLYGKKDADQFLVKSMDKVNKLSTSLQTKHKKLTIFYESWSKSKNRRTAVVRKSQSDDDEKTSEEEIHVREERSISEDKHRAPTKEQGKKDVSECDSDEIFSADETRSAAKKGKNNRNCNDAKTNDADQTSIDKSKDSDANNSRDTTASPVLSASKEKKTTNERSIKKQLVLKSINTNNNEAQSADDDLQNDKQADASIDMSNNESEIEDSPLRDDRKTKTSDNDSTNRENVINESMDLFDTFLDTSKNGIENQTKTQETDVKANSSETRSLSKVDSPKNSEALLQETEVVTRSRISPSPNSEKEEDSPNRDNQNKVIFAPANNEKYHNSKLESITIDAPKEINAVEDSSDAEALAKKALLESDSSDSCSTSITEDINVDIEEEKAKKGDSESDISTVILPFNQKKMESAKNSFTNDTQIFRRESSVQSDKNTDSSDDAKKRQALLESSSDNSIILMSSESEDKRNKSRLFIENMKAKQSLLASSSTEESSDSESKSDTTRVAQNIGLKRNRESDGNGDSPLKKKKKFQLHKNPYYRNDEKLRKLCKVSLMRLNKRILSHHSYALQKSREYLEHKAFKRYREYFLKPLFVVLHRLK